MIPLQATALTIPTASHHLSRPLSYSGAISRPMFATDEVLHSFQDIHTTIEIHGALPLNTPFVGSYHPNLMTSANVHIDQVHIAVFARFDISRNKVWLAVRTIWTAPTVAGRKSKLRWMEIEHWQKHERVELMKPGYQVIVWRKAYAGPEGLPDGEMIKRKWLEIFGLQRADTQNS